MPVPRKPERKKIIGCVNCGDDNFEWHLDIQPNHGQDPSGFYNIHQLQVIAYRSCESCSETVAHMADTEIESILNRKKDA